MLSVQDIHTYYGDSYILQGVSLEVAPGKVVAVLGRNGVGKTTLMNSIIGFTPPRRGKIIFRDRDISRLPTHRIARLGVGLVPQGRRLFPSLTVRETLGLSESVAEDRGSSGIRWTLREVFKAFPRLSERATQRSGDLSGGEQQMLATGRALAINSDLLLLDEPTEGLAPIMVAELEKILLQLKAQGVSMLLVEQQIPFALRLADDVHLMSKGKIAYSGNPAGLLRDRDAMSRYLGV